MTDSAIAAALPALLCTSLMAARAPSSLGRQAAFVRAPVPSTGREVDGAAQRGGGFREDVLNRRRVGRLRRRLHLGDTHPVGGARSHEALAAAAPAKAVRGVPRDGALCGQKALEGSRA